MKKIVKKTIALMLGIILVLATFKMSGLDCFAAEYTAFVNISPSGVAKAGLNEAGCNVESGSTITFTSDVSCIRIDNEQMGVDVDVTVISVCDSDYFCVQGEDYVTRDFDIPAGTYIFTYVSTGVNTATITFSLPSSGGEYWQYAVDDINALGNTETPQSYVFEEGDALPLAVMLALSENGNVSFEFKFVYDGKDCDIYIPAGKAVFDLSIPWYGPCWLAEKYGERSRGTYIIQKGDTLNKLATKFSTTVDDLMKKNPYIKDSHWIYPGNKLEY